MKQGVLKILFLAHNVFKSIGNPVKHFNSLEYAAITPNSCSMRRSRATGTTPTLGAVGLSCACLALAAPSFAFAFNIGPSSVGWVRHHRKHAAAQRAAGTAPFASPTMVAAEPVAGLMKTVTVDLDDRSYPIYIGTGILERYACNAVSTY